jgi:squalene-hopene/tetraprenyl-beta-curcumene cyclase
VPDADDTPAALLAIARWSQFHRGESLILDAQIASAATQGLRWLLSLQNRDGGWPTFCRGWGTLPFDRSGSDLTAHALRAIEVWRRHADWLDPKQSSHVLTAGAKAAERGFQFLAKRQNADGSWFPLWFGNQDRADEENPVYGTAKVLLAYADYRRVDAACQRGLAYLVEHQNADGGWGGGISVPYRVPGVSHAQHGSSVEETGAALEALVAMCSLARGSTADCKPTIMRGLRWLVAAVEHECSLTSWPIGFYFAKLWYHERLYPIIASTAALGAAVERTELWLQSP